MSKTELVDEHVSAQQCKLAVDALLQHEVKRQEKKQQTELLPGKEQNVWLVVTVKQMHPEKKLKPHRIPIKYPLVDPRTSSVCLITKDPQREYKDLLEAEKIRFISRVVGITKLKGKFKPFEARRLWLKENDLFLADERVVPLLPSLLGSKFFAAKKQPIPVSLTKKNLKEELERAISSTYFHQNQGTCSSIKIGTISQSAEHVLTNLKIALPAVVKVIKGNWDNVQSLHIKTNSSTSLPIWTCNLGSEEGGRWNGLMDAPVSEAEDEDEDEEMVSDVPTPKAASKSKKRTTDDEGDKPSKKAKASLDHPADIKMNTDPPSEIVTRSKKRKATAPVEEVVVSSATAEFAPPDATGKKKKRKQQAAKDEVVSSSAPSAQPVEQPVVPADLPTATSESELEKPLKRKKRKSQAIIEASSAEPAPTTSDTQASTTVAPVTPSVSLRQRKKRNRASATDFFDDAQATPDQVVPPLNTPATGLQTPVPSGKKRTKAKAAVLSTPVSGAIGKLADEAGTSASPSAVNGAAQLASKKKALGSGHDGKDAAPATSATSSVVGALSKPLVEASAESGVADGGERKKKRKQRKSQEDAASADAVQAPPSKVDSAVPTLEEVKQKRSASTVEKRKDKPRKAKRSAKDALIGKKGL
ncbi:hypothetical protein PHLCEN_2v12446 [Hermanssonia centrifuga]|uniref:Ribosomal L1 domain-containing protein 1 n=1 Tax=Hermanssonia centrifuga TaxID=98765 RepID=A0A2R6NI75_9APHY|nr:hypothetical protein PHLCEN_2v12446 [Hermanssonia centrifuga]